MKLLIVISGLVVLCAGNAIPLVPRDNSHYVEGESRYIWMPDGRGSEILVDLQAPVDDLFLKTRSGSLNSYWLYTRSNPTNAQIITHGDASSVLNSNYNPNRPTTLIVHGWVNSASSDNVVIIRDAFLADSDVNVIMLDWSQIAGNINYIIATNAVPSVGEFAGNFLTWLFDTAGGDWNNLHLVGFSLGAHVVGNAGRAVSNRAIRVTGLDPAGPLWTNNPDSLSPTDGQYVEAIHTDGGVSGIFNTVAMADFYPNGGKHPQPGCSNNSCSHGRATDFFAASVHFDHLVGRLCSEFAQAESNQCSGSTFNMGNGILTKRGSGIYGLTTGSVWPF